MKTIRLKSFTIATASCALTCALGLSPAVFAQANTTTTTTTTTAKTTTEGGAIDSAAVGGGGPLVAPPIPMTTVTVSPGIPPIPVPLTDDQVQQPGAAGANGKGTPGGMSKGAKQSRIGSHSGHHTPSSVAESVSVTDASGDQVTVTRTTEVKSVRDTTLPNTGGEPLLVILGGLTLAAGAFTWRRRLV